MTLWILKLIVWGIVILILWRIVKPYIGKISVNGHTDKIPWKGLITLLIAILVLCTIYAYLPDSFLTKMSEKWNDLKTPAKFLIGVVILTLIGAGLYSLFYSEHTTHQSGGGHGGHDEEHHAPQPSRLMEFLKLAVVALVAFCLLAILLNAADKWNKYPEGMRTEETGITLETPATGVNLAGFPNGFRIVSTDSIRYTIPGYKGTFLYVPGDENGTSEAPAAKIKSWSEYNFSFWDPKDPIKGKITFKIIAL